MGYGNRSVLALITNIASLNICSQTVLVAIVGLRVSQSRGMAVSPHCMTFVA